MKQPVSTGWKLTVLYRLNDIDIDLHQYEIRANGQPLSVEPKVFDLIIYLINNRSRLVSRNELLEQVWHGREVSDTTLSNHIKSARKVLGDNGDLQGVIKTVRSRGYQFIADIEEYADAIAASALEKTPTPVLTNQTKKNVAKAINLKVIILAILCLVVVNVLWNFLSTDTKSSPHVLVVPFSIASNNTDNWHAFADQMTRELIQDLRKISGLTVVPPPSAFTFKANKFRQHIKDRLPKVTHVLDGVVSEGHDGNIRITIEVEEITTGALLWNGDFDIQRDNNNLFRIQNDIAASVSASLKVIILAEEKQQLAKTPTSNLSAYELYIKGQHEFSLMTYDSVLRSITHFNQAIKLDPNFEAAYIAKSNAYRIIMVLFDKPKDVLPKVISSAIALLAINPNSAQIKSSLGLAYVHAWLWDDAWKMLTEARKNDATIALTELGFALYYAAMGNVDGVKRSLATADKLDPLNTEIAEWGLWALMMTGELEAASKWGRNKKQQHPNVPYLDLGLAIAEYMQGNYDTSIALAAKGVQLTNRAPFGLIILAQAYAAAGKVDKVVALIKEAEMSSQYMCPYETAIIYALTNETDKVFPLLDKAVEFQSNCLIFTRYDPRFKSLRSDPRYLEVLKKIALDDESVSEYSQ